MSPKPRFPILISNCTPAWGFVPDERDASGPRGKKKGRPVGFVQEGRNEKEDGLNWDRQGSQKT